MSMSYDDFKTYLITHLWKVGDSVVIASLDTLIMTANAELDKVLKVAARDATATLVATSNSVPLPTDCKTIRSLTVPINGDSPTFNYVLPNVIAESQVNFLGQALPIYSTTGGNLLLVTNASASYPLSVALTYYNKLPDYKETGTSWVADDFFDVYLYCVLKHTAPFLREDERVSMWLSYYKDALEAALIDDNDVKYSGSPLEITFS